MDLSDVTLLILSHNRQHCLKKTLNFYLGTGIKLLVLDNSPNDLDHEFIPENCRYINVGDSFSVRSGMAKDLIATPFTIIGADDEVYLPTSIEIMRDFLKANPDYVAAGGNAVAVWKYGPQVSAAWAYKNTFKYHNDANSSIERIRLHTGDGVNPLTSFFTCNLTRSSVVSDCLEMYAKAPVLATDAISVLTICGAGKSKYLDVTYWIRNWNQSPKSHSGWDRRVFLHTWWNQAANLGKRNSFYQELKRVYSKHSDDDKFEDSWNLILKSDQVLQRQQSVLSIWLRKFSELPNVKSAKYMIKRFFRIGVIPDTSKQIKLIMQKSGVLVPEEEYKRATLLVSGIIPYENW